MHDANDTKVTLPITSPFLAPKGTYSRVFEWRQKLQKGDLVDIEDHFGNWVNGTVLEVLEKGGGKKDVKVAMKVWHREGNRNDQNGRFYGFDDYEEVVDFTSTKLAPYCSIAK